MEIIQQAGAAEIIYCHKRKNGFNLFSHIINRRTQPNTNSLFTQIVHNESIYPYPCITSIITATVQEASWISKASPLLRRATERTLPECQNSNSTY